MPIIKSAKKRVRVANRAAVRNSKTKRNLRTALKLFAKSPSAKGRGEAVSNIDKAVKKGVIHKNKAARLKRQAAIRAKSAGVKPTKTVAKKTASAKKTPTAKKPVAKKTPSKK